MLTWRWLLPLVVAFLLYAAPLPPSIETNARVLLSIFGAFVVALITTPLPMGAMAMVALTAAMLTGAVSGDAAFSAFGAPVLWLIVSALVMARGLTETGLSRRIAYRCIAAFGKSSLRLAYSLGLADLLLAPFIPSDTARAGGIMFPVARSLAETNESYPGATAERLGRYLMQSVYHVGVTTAAMFVTSMSANPLLVDLAKSTAGVEITWGEWALAACLPGGLALLVIPWLIYRLDPPSITATPEAPVWAREQLAQLGPMSSLEKWQILILGLLIAGWMTQPLHGFHPAVIAVTGLSLALITGVVRWDHVLEERGAWDALVWFGVVLMLAKALNEAGVITAITTPVLSGFRFESWLIAMALAVSLYVMVHYLYASMTAQIVTLYPVFVALALVNNVPAMVAALMFAFFSSLNASVTHYGSGSGPVVFSAAYVTQLEWWRTGLIIALAQLAIWLSAGLVWWRFIGLY